MCAPARARKGFSSPNEEFSFSFYLAPLAPLRLLRPSRPQSGKVSLAKVSISLAPPIGRPFFPQPASRRGSSSSSWSSSFAAAAGAASANLIGPKLTNSIDRRPNLFRSSPICARRQLGPVQEAKKPHECETTHLVRRPEISQPASARGQKRTGRFATFSSPTQKRRR